MIELPARGHHAQVSDEILGGRDAKEGFVGKGANSLWCLKVPMWPWGRQVWGSGGSRRGGASGSGNVSVSAHSGSGQLWRRVMFGHLVSLKPLTFSGTVLTHWILNEILRNQEASFIGLLRNSFGLGGWPFSKCDCTHCLCF